MKIKGIKQSAKQVLMAKSNRLQMVAVSLLLVFAAFLPMLLAGNISNLIFGEESSPTVDAVFYSLWGVLAVFVTAPALTLLYRRAYLIYRKEKDGLAAPYALSKCGYGRSLVAGLAILVRPLILFGLFAGGYALAAENEFLIYIPLMFCAIGLSFLVMWGTGGMFLFPYYVCRGEPLGRALGASFRGMKNNYKGYGAYMLAFLGWVLLSLLTAGVLLALHTLPLMMLTYFIFAERLDGKQQMEETDHE